MADPYAATRELLEDRPGIADAMESLLDADATGAWTFDDVDVDSGTFGELVSRGVVERTDDGDAYRLADREAVRAALDGEPYDGSGATTDDGGRTGDLGAAIRERVEGVADGLHRDLVVALAGALTLLFVFRTFTVTRVFREDRVLLPGNDPYHYLTWVDRLAAADVGRLDFAGIAEVLGGRASGEPLTYTLGWWATGLVGVDGDGTAAVVAWLPVVAALVVGIGVYLIATWTTNDERIGVASVVALALLPGHALYSGIGFFDHHAVDYVWLTLSIVGVTWLARDHETRAPDARVGHLTSPATWAVVGLLGVVFAAMVHTWNGSPILLVGLAVYATLRASSDLRAGWNPLVAAAPVVGALGVGFALAYALHTRAGWQEPLAVYALALVAVGVVCVAGAAAVLGRFDAHPGIHLGLSAASVVPLWLGFRRVRPDEAARLTERALDSLLGREGIAETRALFASDFGVFLGPIDHFGWFLFVALPVLGWAGWQCVVRHEPRWLVVVGYASALIGFALVQIRFAGEATGVVAVCAGVGLVYLLSVIDVAERPEPFGPRPDRVHVTLRPPGLTGRQVGYALGVVGLVASLSLVMVPAVMDTVAATDDEAGAIEWIDADAAEREGPDFVLSEWGRNRMFNYAVRGDGDGYGYAFSNYEPFVSDADPDAHADGFAGTVGYVAIHEIDGSTPGTSVYDQLFEAHGSATDAANGSGRFQLGFVADGGEVKVFRPVEGAAVTGEAEPGETVTVTTDVETAGETFTYERRTTADADGTFDVRVAYPGEYTAASGDVSDGDARDDGDGTVTVTPDAVEEGEAVAVDV